MSDDSNNDADKNTDKNTTIKDKGSDKKFFASLGTWLVVLTVNIMLGSYIIYASKILHVIQLPTNLDAAPYTNTKDEEAKEAVDAANAAATLPFIYIIPRILKQMTPFKNNTVGINYLNTIIQPVQNEVVDDIADGADGSVGDRFSSFSSNSNSSTITNNSSSDTDVNVNTNNQTGTRVPYFTKIYVNPDNYKNIFNETDFLGSLLYQKNDTVLWVITLLIIQQYYFYIYYSICVFFSFVYDNSKGSYFQESLMLLFGFPLFLVYSMLRVALLGFLLPIWILIQVPKLWSYESSTAGIRVIDDRLNFPDKYGPVLWRVFLSFWILIFYICGALFLLSISYILAILFFQVTILPYIFYIFYKIISIKCKIINDTNLTINGSPVDINPFSKTASIVVIILITVTIICNILPIPGFVSLIIPLTLIIKYIYDAYNVEKENYSVATLLLSKIEVITYVIAIIFLWCTKTSYGWNVFGIVLFFVGLLIFLCLRGLITFMFYPYIVDPENTSLFIEVNEYTDIDSKDSGCYMKKTKNLKEKELPHSILGLNMLDIFNKVVKLSKKDDSKFTNTITNVESLIKHGKELLNTIQKFLDTVTI
jgi:hypothetical protein